MKGEMTIERVHGRGWRNRWEWTVRLTPSVVYFGETATRRGAVRRSDWWIADNLHAR